MHRCGPAPEGKETMRFRATLAIIIVGASGAWLRGSVTRYYRFETNNGLTVSNNQSLTVADDASGNNLNGTPLGSAKYATTPFAGPVPSTGASNQFCLLNSTSSGVLLNGNSSPILAPAFTVEADFRLTSTDPNTGDVKAIFRVEDPNTGTGVCALELLNLNGTGGTNDLLLVMSNDTLELRRFDLSPNTNYSVAATCSGTDVELYLNGTLVDSTAISPQPSFAPFTGSGTIGGAIGNSVVGTASFQGYIDEVRFSNSVLSPSQFLNAVPEPSSGFVWALACLSPFFRRRSRAGGTATTLSPHS